MSVRLAHRTVARWAVPALFLIALSAPVVLWKLTGNTLPWLDIRSSPPGQWLYILSKLAALYAVALIGLQLSLLVLQTGTTTKQHRLWSLSVHRVLGMITLIVITVHVTAFTAATSVRNGELALHLFLPVLGDGYYRTMISIGALGLWLSIIGASLQLRIAHRIGLRWLHPYLMLIAAVLVTVHSYGIGSESGTNVVAIFYCILLLLILRLWASRRSRIHRASS